MRLALIGKGRMGQTVSRLAESAGHRIVTTLDQHGNLPTSTFSGDWVSETEVLIDFSAPSAAVENVLRAARTGIPIVQGTTGWYDRLEWLRNELQGLGGSCVFASNFSLGMQLFFRIIGQIAPLMARFDSYGAYLSEQHHRAKKDAPSGTALQLLEILKRDFPREISTSVLRAGSIPGTHEVGFDSAEDSLLFRHTARNRDGFARGALLAAELIRGKTGFFEFRELLFHEN
jgi:4-hydroxy-tetrahydrodipicolinate reductase